MDFLGQTWVLSKTVVTIAYSDPYETILEGNQKNVKKIQKSILLCPIIRVSNTISDLITQPQKYFGKSFVGYTYNR